MHGGDFTFVGRQRRLRIDDECYRIDLLFFHRRLRSLVIIDLKLGKFTHADAGQMHLSLNYAREHWVVEGENPPIGIILCASKGQTLVKYALEGLPNKVIAAEYRTALPSEAELSKKLEETRLRIELQKPKSLWGRQNARTTRWALGRVHREPVAVTASGRRVPCRLG